MSVARPSPRWAAAARPRGVRSQRHEMHACARKKVGEREEKVKRLWLSRYARSREQREVHFRGGGGGGGEGLQQHPRAAGRVCVVILVVVNLLNVDVIFQLASGFSFPSKKKTYSHGGGREAGARRSYEVWPNTSWRGSKVQSGCGRLVPRGDDEKEGEDRVRSINLRQGARE